MQSFVRIFLFFSSVALCVEEAVSVLYKSSRFTANPVRYIWNQNSPVSISRRE